MKRTAIQLFIIAMFWTSEGFASDVSCQKIPFQYRLYRCDTWLTADGMNSREDLKRLWIDATTADIAEIGADSIFGGWSWISDGEPGLDRDILKSYLEAAIGSIPDEELLIAAWTELDGEEEKADPEADKEADKDVSATNLGELSPLDAAIFGGFGVDLGVDVYRVNPTTYFESSPNPFYGQ